MLQARLEVIDGGTERTNLKFVVMPTTASQRIEHIHNAIADALGQAGGGAIVYCATKRSTEETAQALADRGVQGQFVLSKNFRRNNRLGSMLDLAARMG